jgi:hypothetical protein
MPEDWDASVVRLSLFSGEQLQISDADWKSLTGETEAPTRHTTAGLRRLSGKVLGGALSIGSAGNRVDVVLGPDESAIDAEDDWTLPVVGPWEQVRKHFVGTTITWLESRQNRFNRVAFGATLLKQVATVEAGYAELSPLLTSLTVDPARMRDLLYRVNWPRESGVITGLTINRLTTWALVALARKLLSMTGADLTVAQQQDLLHAVRLEVDHNTPADHSEHFDPSQIIAIYRELVDLAVENASKGELA